MAPASSAVLQRSTFFDYPDAEAAPRKIVLFDRRRDAAWVDPVLAALERLSQLFDDWDGRGARAPNFYDVLAALTYLQRVMRDDTRPPHVVPLNSGGIELSWDEDGLEVEAIFDQARDENLLLVTAGSNNTEEPIDSSEMLFATIVDRLAIPGL